MTSHRKGPYTMRGKVSADSDRGAVLIVVAMCLLLIFGLTALAIDGGMAYNERRSTQGAADHAALAAAWAACNAEGEAAAVAAGREAAARNGYDDTTNPDISVTVSRVGGSQAKYEAVIRSTNENEFGQVVGQDGMTIESRAVADCLRKVWGGGYALFAEGDEACTNNELDFTGGNVEVNGQVHSNGDLRIRGNASSPSQINGLVTYVGHPDYNPNQVDFNGGGPDSSVTQPDPFQIDIEQFRPTPANTARSDYFWTPGDITNGWLESYGSKISGVIHLEHSGIYYAGGEIENVKIAMGTDANTGQPTRATFVAEGQISITDGGTNFYDPSGVAIFSNYQPPGACANDAIVWTASVAAWEGLVYAPNGEIRMSLSSGTTFDGAIVGYEVNLQGSAYSITWKDVTGGGPEFELEFEE